MKYYHSLAIVLLLFVFGCEDDEPAPPVKTPEEIVKEEVSEALAAEADLSQFVAVFEELELAAADVESGLTMFAPANDNSGGRMKSGNETVELTTEILKGHIVKGLIDALDLEDGEILEALDGKDLVVSIVGEEIRINGVLISSKDLVKSEKYIVHKVEQIIGEPLEEEEPASLTVTVWNSFLWTPENPKGLPEAGVTVSFYTAPEDYADGTAVYSGETNAEGQVTFAEAEAGTTYYIVAQKGDLSNIINRSAEPIDGVYHGLIPDGIFQTMEEIANHAVQPGAGPGNFKWKDLNADGIINLNDRGVVPHLEAVAVAGVTEVEAFIGYENNDAMSITDGEDALQALQTSRTIINSMHKTLVMADGILSDDAECPETNPNWCAFDNFSLNPTNSLVTKVWVDGYNAIAQLNMLVRDLPGLTFIDKETVLAQAKGLRAYVYLELVTYFGGVPIPEGIWLGDSEVRASVDEVYQFITADLESAVDMLPTFSEDRAQLTLSAAKILLARVALYKQDYSKVATLTSEVLDGGFYSLVGSDEVFISATNSEIIWNFSSSVSPEFSAYFFGRTFSPTIRLAEVYLMKAEALLELDNLEQGGTALESIRARRGMPPLSPGLSKDDLRSELRSTWQVEMSREGDRFTNIIRWGLTLEALFSKGFNPDVDSKLPIPQVVIDKHFNIIQNPGY